MRKHRMHFVLYSYLKYPHVHFKCTGYPILPTYPESVTRYPGIPTHPWMSRRCRVAGPVHRVHVRRVHVRRRHGYSTSPRTGIILLVLVLLVLVPYYLESLLSTARVRIQVPYPYEYSYAASRHDVRTSTCKLFAICNALPFDNLGQMSDKTKQICQR